MKPVTAFYAGSFDPFTRGHEDILRRALALFESVIIGIGYNEAKRTMFSAEERCRQITAFYAEEARVRVVVYDGLTTDAASARGADVLVRGVRSADDFAYEWQLATLNRRLSGLDTVFLFAADHQMWISSSAVRELIGLGRNVREFLPEGFPLEQPPAGSRSTVDEETLPGENVR